VAIHGNKSQGQRVRALADFKTGRTPILVATEIAARGLDIDGLPHVVNFELPMVPEDYVHRIGRTGRAGSPGHAVSLVCVDELKLLGEIQRVLGGPIPQEVIAGFEPDRSVRPEPILRGGLGRGRPDSRGPRVGGHADRGGYAGPRRPAPAFHPGAGASQQARPAHGYPAQGRPAQGRPGQHSGQGRPAHGRPAHGRPQQPRPGQGIGNGGPGPRPGGPRAGQSGAQPHALPGERLARSERRG
jgi:ATP-dependent RNA helicase RhlE